MASKLVTDRQKSADAVAAIAEAQVQTLGGSIRTVLASGDDTSVNTLVADFQRTLLARKDAMVSADEAHERELADDAPARADRDDAAASLTAKLVELREVLTGLFGYQITKAILPESTPRDPVVLERFAGQVSLALGSVQLPTPRVAGAQIDTTSTARALSASQAELRARVDAVTKEVREAQDTLAKKNRAIEEYDRVFQGVATVLTGLFILAGQDELANKVRPSSRRPGRTQEQEAREESSS